VEPDPESWEYRKAYAISSTLTRWGVPRPIRALAKLIVMPPIVVAAVLRAIARGDLRA
jgi:hypothetical protein